MKIYHMVVLFLAASFVAVSHASAAQLLYLASTQEKTIVAYKVNDDTGALT